MCKVCKRAGDGKDSGVDESMDGSGKWGAFGDCQKVLLSRGYAEWRWRSKFGVCGVGVRVHFAWRVIEAERKVCVRSAILYNGVWKLDMGHECGAEC